MPFNVNKFVATHFKPRTKEVPVPELRELFDNLKEDEEPVFIVKSLTRVDFIRMQEVVSRDQNWSALLTAAGAGNARQLLEQVKSELGLSDDLPDGAAREIVMLEAGVEEPKLSREAAVKLYDVQPMLVSRLITAISDITNAGWEPGKPKPSTPVPISATG